MPVRRVGWLAWCLVLAACDGKTSGAGAAIAAVVSTAADDTKVQADLRATLAAHDVVAVVALDAAGLRAARAVVAGSARPGARIVAIADPALADPKAVAETLIADVTGAAVAVDLALLAASGLDVPARFGIGTRTLTAANAAAGGTARPAPGDPMFEILRRQHANVLTTTPSIDVVLPIALVQMRADGGWQDRVRNEPEAAAKRYPQLGMRVHVADGTAAKFEALAAAALQENVRALLLVATDWSAMTAIAKLPRDGKVALIAIDPSGEVPHATTVVGADQQILGRAAGEATRALLGGGGACVLLHGELAGAAALRRQGFTAALGLPAKAQ
jgi:hypothetical protein